MTEDDGHPNSYQDYRVGQQLYAVIEFCNTPEALWGKLESGKWDWLGVKSAGSRHTFVLGRPPVSRMGSHAAWEVGEVGASGDHHVIVEVPNRRVALRRASRRNCLSPETARAQFACTNLSMPDGGSGVFRVSLYIDDRLEEQRVVLRTMPNLYPPSKKHRESTQ